MPRIRMFDTWGGLRTLQDPSALGPALSQSMKDVELWTGILKNRLDDIDMASATTTVAASIYDYAGTLIYDTVYRQYTKYGTRLIKNDVFSGTQVGPQYSLNGTTWDILGIKEPPTACSAAVGAAGTPNGSYQYYVTYYNANGDESPPSPISGTVTVVNQRVSLTAIPIGTGNATHTNGSAVLTAVSNASSYRVGQRIKNVDNAVTGKYVTAVGGSTVTLDSVSLVTATDNVYDQQIVGRKIYRIGGTSALIRLVTTVADMVTTTYTDNTSDSALGATLSTYGLSVLPLDLHGACISDDGLLMAVDDTLVRVYFSEPNGRIDLYTPGNYVDVVDYVCGATYALDRFVLFTRQGITYITGSDPTSLAVHKAAGIAPSEPQVRNCPTVGDDGLLWFVAKPGVCVFDGSQIKLLTANTFNVADNASIYASAVGACRWGARWVILTKLPDDSDVTFDKSLLIFDPAVKGAWYRWALQSPAALVTAMTYYSSFNCVVVHYKKASTYKSFGIGLGAIGNPTGRVTGGYYKTTDWGLDTEEVLKDFRRVYLLHDEDVTVQTYVDGVALGSPETASLAAFGESELFLPGTDAAKGRTFAVKFTLAEANSYVSIAGADLKAYPR